ncbi:MAG: hypothetical protein AABN95_26675 [Acidobacteriota bacterium]
MKSLEEVELDLKAVTSRLTLIDEIIKASKLGRDMRMVFRCNHSGLHLPSDYIKEWGTLYGIGLGPDPVSEVLDTDYNVDPPAITPAIRSIEQIMHPVGNVRVQVDMDLVSADDLNLAILVKDDPYMIERARIVRGKQLINPKGRLRVMQAAWERRA